MCCCGKPTVNGEEGYSWDGERKMIRKPDPPEVADGDALLFDEPGRCGGIDAHCYHFRVINEKHSPYCTLLVRHGNDERVKLHDYAKQLPDILLHMESNKRFWLLFTIYAVAKAEREKARDDANAKWSRAFIDKRIKKRKRKGLCSVWIEQASDAG